MIEEVIENLEKNNITAHFVNHKEEALSKCLTLIPRGSKVGFGDSLTLEQIDIHSALKERGYLLFNPWDKEAVPDGPSSPEGVEIMRKALTADIFLSGTNALSKDGKLINIDALGNRVAALLFGPKEVIVVVGINKIVPNQEEGLKRIKEIAAPLNAKRKNLDVPCLKIGRCLDCPSNSGKSILQVASLKKRRICSAIVIIEKQFYKGRMSVIIVGESLGL